MQEAAALTELEDRMKMSNRLLARKEVAINQLQASLAQEVNGDGIWVAKLVHIPCNYYTYMYDNVTLVRSKYLDGRMVDRKRCYGRID